MEKVVFVTIINQDCPNSGSKYKNARYQQESMTTEQGRDYSEKQNSPWRIGTDEIRHTAKSVLAQMKVVDDGMTVSSVKSNIQQQQQKTGHGLRDEDYENIETVEANTNTTGESFALQCVVN